jgi:hypothetical protein
MPVRLSASLSGRPLPPEKFLVLISVRGWVDPRAIVRLEGLGQLKNPMISSGIEPATFRLEELRKTKKIKPSEDSRCSCRNLNKVEYKCRALLFDWTTFCLLSVGSWTALAGCRPDIRQVCWSPAEEDFLCVRVWPGFHWTHWTFNWDQGRRIQSIYPFLSSVGSQHYPGPPNSSSEYWNLLQQIATWTVSSGRRLRLVSIPTIWTGRMSSA